MCKTRLETSTKNRPYFTYIIAHFLSSVKLRTEIMMKMAIREMCLSDFTIFSTTKCQVEMGRTVGIYKIMSKPREKFVLLTTSLRSGCVSVRKKQGRFGQNHGRIGISAKNARRFASFFFRGLLLGPVSGNFR